MKVRHSLGSMKKMHGSQTERRHARTITVSTANPVATARQG